MRKRFLQAGFSILDQGLVSGANFVLSVSLARILPASEYGAFSISFTIFLLVAGIHHSLLLEPMSVLGPARHGAQLEPYLRRSVWVHFALTGFLAAAGLIASIFYWATPLGKALLAMFATLPLVLLYWLARRAHYLETRPELAAGSSAIYCVTLAVSSLVLWRSHALTTPGAFFATAIAALTASLYSFQRLGLNFSPRMESWRALIPVAREQWDFGKWMLPSTLLYPLLSQIQIFFTGAYLGLGEAGVFRALQNPILPILQVVTALYTLTVPILSRDFTTKGVAVVYRRGLMVAGAMVAIAFAFEGGVLLTGNLWDRLLYGGRYAAYGWLMPVLGVMAIATSVATGCSGILRAIQLPGFTTVAHLAGGVFGAASAYILIRTFRLPGAVYGLVGSHVIVAVASGFLLLTGWNRAMRTKPAGWATRQTAP